MTTIVTIELRAKKGLGNELVSTFKQFTPIARRTDGNLSIQLMQDQDDSCLLYTSPSPRDLSTSRMPSSA